MALKFIYTLFLGLLVSLFIGLGISAFYEAPKMPEHPTFDRPGVVIDGKIAPEETPEQKAEREAYEKESKEYFDVIRPRYERNVSMIALIGAIIILVVSLTAATKIDFLSDGLLLGGVFTLLYAIVRGFMANDLKYNFVVVTVGLLVALILGYIKFIRTQKA